MRVAVAKIAQHRLALAVTPKLARQPDLARATLHLVRLRMLGVRHWLQRAAELDDVPVAVVPILQQRKIIPDLVDRRHRTRMSCCGTYIGRRRLESEFARNRSAG